MILTRPAEPSSSSASAVSNSNTTTTTSTTVKAKSTPQDAVADLERRLAALGSGSPEETVSGEATSAPSSASTMTPTSAASTAAAAAAVKGGKNALLARIMAAQERAKQTQGAPATVAMGVSVAAPPQASLPPPAFDETLLPPQWTVAPPAQEAPPPAFDESLLPPPPASAGTASMMEPPAPILMWDPHAPVLTDFMAPSAPHLDDLLDGQHHHHAQELPPPMQAPSDQGAVDSATMEAILALEGLSPAEKQAMLEEQMRIMASIEQNKTANQAAVAHSAADAFEQRSLSQAVQAVGSTNSARATSSSSSKSKPSRAVQTVNLGSGQEVTLHGQERTRQAIAEGTALLVQCLSCENWMQVTSSATLMFCPVCQVVSPVEKGAANTIPLQDDDAASSAEQMQQMQRDMDLAEQLQREEYKKAARPEGQARPNASPTAAAAPAASSSSTKSWMEWLGLSTPTTTPEAPTQTTSYSAPSSPDRSLAFAQRPLNRGEIGVSRPPGSAQTGEEIPGISYSRSYEEQDSLLRHDHLPAPARVAERQPLFACVADSLTTAATSLTTALHTTTLQEDEEGNIHGVDASSLLVMPQVSRGGQGDGGRSGGSSSNYAKFDD